GGESGSIPAHHRLHDRHETIGRHHHRPTRTHQCRGIQPAPQCFLRGTKIDPVQQSPTVQEHRRRKTVLRDRLGTRCGHHQAGPVRHVGEDLLPSRGTHGQGRKCSSQFLGGASSTHHHCTHPVSPTFRTRPPAADTATPTARGHRV